MIQLSESSYRRTPAIGSLEILTPDAKLFQTAFEEAQVANAAVGGKSDEAETKEAKDEAKAEKKEEAAPAKEEAKAESSAAKEEAKET